MDAHYSQHSQPPPQQPQYTMPPGLPPMSSNDVNYHREPPGPGPPYYAPSAPQHQHQQNGQQYGHHPNTLPSPRKPLPDQLMSVENTAPSLPLPPGQLQVPEPPIHSMVEYGKRYTYVCRISVNYRATICMAIYILAYFVLEFMRYIAVLRMRLTCHIRLDVVQQPKRARMCGFGDKVRIEEYLDYKTIAHIPFAGSTTNHTTTCYSNNDHRSYNRR
jgi:hypothetical protein